MNFLRILTIGGLTSYRALFGWLSPWILIPSFLVTPLAQILLFAYIGRSAGVGSDEFFVIGNALQYNAIPCLFGMANTIVGERLQGTLGLILVSPASRLALIIGRSLPVLINGFAVSLFGFVAGSAMLGSEVRIATLGPIMLAISATVFACTGLGLANAALGLRFQDTAVLSNLIFGVLLLFCGANIPSKALPGWMSQVGNWLPLTHGIDAARTLAAGGNLAGVRQLLMTEILLGIGYGIIGAAMLRLFEIQ